MEQKTLTDTAVKINIMNCDPSIRRKFLAHFPCFDIALKTFLRIQMPEVGEKIPESINDKDASCDTRYYSIQDELNAIASRFADKCVKEMLIGLLPTPIKTDQDMRDWFATLNDLINRLDETSCKIDNKDETFRFIISRLIPFKFEELELWEYLSIEDINDFDSFNKISNFSYSSLIVKYLSDLLLLYNIPSFCDDIAALLHLLMKTITPNQPSDSYDGIVHNMYNVYIRYIANHTDTFYLRVFMRTLDNLDKKEIDTFEVLSRIKFNKDVIDGKITKEAVNNTNEIENMFVDTITYSDNNYQVFGDSKVLTESGIDNSITKLLYKVEELNPEEINLYFGEENRIDFELTEQMLCYLLSKIKPYSLTIRSRNGHIRRYVAKIDEKVFLLFRIYNDPDCIYGISLLSSRDMDMEEYRDTLVINMDDSDYSMKVGELNGNV